MSDLPYFVSLFALVVAIAIWLWLRERPSLHEQSGSVEALGISPSASNNIGDGILRREVPRFWIVGRDDKVEVSISAEQAGHLFEDLPKDSGAEKIKGAPEFGVQVRSERNSFVIDPHDDEVQTVGPEGSKWRFYLEPRKTGKYRIRVLIKRYFDGKPVPRERPLERSRMVEVGADPTRLAALVAKQTANWVIGALVGFAVGTALTNYIKKNEQIIQKQQPDRAKKTFLPN